MENKKLYLQAGEGDDELADVVWKKKKWIKLWRKIKNEIFNNNK